MALLLSLFAYQPLGIVALFVALPYLTLYAAFTKFKILDRHNALGD